MVPSPEEIASLATIAFLLGVAFGIVLLPRQFGTSAIGHRLALLHRASVIAFTFPARYKGERGSVAALKFLADDSF